MKAFVFACLAIAATAFARPAAAHSEPERAVAATTAAIAGAPRPLMHFLINFLELQEHQMLAVQKALKAHPLKANTPAELFAVLRPALTDQQFARLQSEMSERELQEELRYLATLR